MKYNQELPKEVEKRLDDYIERIKAIKWFQPSPDLKKAEVEKHLDLVFETFGVKAKIEYKQLRTGSDWDAARGASLDIALDTALGAAKDTAWDAALDTALGAAKDTAKDTALDTALGAAWGAAWDAARDAARATLDAAKGADWDAAWDAALDAAWDAARGAQDLLVQDLEAYKTKYPKGSFINLIPLWEMGLYPAGIVDGSFLIYVPSSKQGFPSDLI